MSSKLVLVLNCGSSSLKFAIIDAVNGEEYLSGLAECFHLPEARIKWKMDGNKQEAALGAGAAHSEALNFIVNTILAQKPELSAQLTAIGHRIVHGGEKYTSSVVIDESVIQGIKDAASFAPLHNPAHLIGIEEALKSFPQLKDKNVAVFDTAFHQTMPGKAYMYAIPYEYYQNDGIHRYVSARCAELMGKPIEELKLISCHMGNGSSICAIDGGKCVDTSMGFTPLVGLPMGTRCGDLDAGVIQFIMNKYGISIDEMLNILNKKSGVLGVSGVSSDFRDLDSAAADGNDRAQLALDMFHYWVAKVVGSYVAAMNGVDAIIFTAGVGENSKSSRAAIAEYFGYLGVKIDEAANSKRGEDIMISTPDSKVKVFVIPTNEELVIARDTKAICG